MRVLGEQHPLAEEGVEHRGVRERPPDPAAERGHGLCFWGCVRSALTFLAELPPRERVVALTMVAAMSLSSYAFIKAGFHAAINGTLQELCREDEEGIRKSFGVALGLINSTEKEE